MRIVLALVFLGMPLAEIAVLIAVGSRIGVGWTLLLILATTILGVATVRRQSLANLRSAQAQARNGAMPGREMVHGALIAFAGLLLILPGFITDTLGLLLLVPPLRDAAWHWLKSRVVVRTHTSYGASYGARPVRPDVVDLSEEEFERRDDARGPGGDPGSPWREIEARTIDARTEAPGEGPRRD